MLWDHFTTFRVILKKKEEESSANAGARGVACVTRFITGHEQTQFNCVCYCLFFGVFLVSK